MTQAAKFVPYNGYLMGLPTDENHLVFRWIGEGKVLFSVAQKGLAASCHFASDKKGLRHLKQACDEFVTFVFFLFDWCKMVIAQVERPNVGKMIEKIGFSRIARTPKGLIYVRYKDGIRG